MILGRYSDFLAKMHFLFSVLTIVFASSIVVSLVTGTSTLSTWPLIVMMALKVNFPSFGKQKMSIYCRSRGY